MKKLTIIIILVGIFTAWLNVNTWANDKAIGLGIVVQAWRMLESNRLSDPELDGRIRFSVGDYGVKVNFINGNRTNKTMCWKFLWVEELPGGDSNIFRQNGIQVDDWILLFDIRPDHFVGFNCSTTTEKIANNFQDGMDIVSDGGTLRIRYIRIRDWGFNESGQRVPNGFKLFTRHITK